MTLRRHDYGGDGVCNRCSHDSFSSGSDYCDDNPPKVLDRHHGMVPNPAYVPPDQTPLVPPCLHLTEPGPPSPPSVPHPSRMVVVYIAGPFRGATAYEVRQNILRAESLGLDVARLGAMPLIPHTNTGGFDSILPCGFMLAATLELMRRCDAVIFTPDWQRSVGARGEHDEAVRMGLPRFFDVAALQAWLEAR